MIKNTIYVLLLVLCTSTMTANEKQQKEHYYEKVIQRFEVLDSRRFPPKNATLFIGSSSVRLWKTLRSDFPEIKTINRGFGGSQTSDVLYFIDRILIPYKPRTIVFYCGENDIAAKKDVSVPVEDFKEIIKHIRKLLPQAVVYYVSMKPSPSRAKMWDKMQEANRQIEKFCHENSVYNNRKTLDYIDVSAAMMKNGKADESIFIKDMLHMNAEGYRRWTEIIRSKLIADGLLTVKERK